MKFFFLQCSQCVIEQVIKINLKKKSQLWPSRFSIQQKQRFGTHAKILNFDGHCAHIKRFAIYIWIYEKGEYHFINFYGISYRQTNTHEYIRKRTGLKLSSIFLVVLHEKKWNFWFILPPWKIIISFFLFSKLFNFFQSRLSLIVSTHTRWLLLIKNTLEQQQAIILLLLLLLSPISILITT